MTRHSVLCLLLVLAARASAPPPPAEPREAAGIIRVWGTEELKPVLGQWQHAFEKTHPTARFELHMTGSDIALPGLYTRRADIALLGRDATAAEIKAFEWIFRYQPVRIEIATGSLGTPGRSPPIVVYVHRDNPLGRLTLAELGAAFSGEGRRGETAAIRTWGQLGLTGDWRDRPIHLYAPDTEEGTGRFFRSVVLNDSRMLDWEHLQEFTDTKGTPATHDAGKKILTALSSDPLGLAVAGTGFHDPRVKPLALAAASNGPFLLPTIENLTARTYPLTRVIYAYVNRAPGASLDPKLREFLAYVLSAEGQEEIGQAGDYLPLSQTSVTSARSALR